ncbi:MAG: hypothetical protein ACO3F0_04205 [Ilumatobacteraceae bacterium]
MSYHNVAWTLSLMEQARSSIINGTFQALRSRVRDVWATVA